MAFDELATLVVALDPEDLPQLGRICSLLENIRAGHDPDSEIARLAGLAIACAERIILREQDSADRLIQLSGLVSNMQACADGLPPSDSQPVAGQVSNLSQMAGCKPAPPNDSAKTFPTAAVSPPPALPQIQIEALTNDPSLTAEFVAESLDHVTAAEAALLALETSPNDADSINAVFRAFHTIKGTSGFLGLSDIQNLAHKAETLLDRARSKAIRLTGGYADLSLAAADTLKRMIQAVADGQPADDSADNPQVRELLDRLADPEQFGIDESCDESVLKPRVGDLLVSTGKADREQVEAVAANRQQPIGQSLVQAGIASAPDVAGALRTQRKLAGDGADNTIRVSTQRLDGLINLVGELVITQAMLAQSGRRSTAAMQGFMRTVSQMGKITRELQDLSMSLRMVPLKSTFQKMARLVRDLSRKSGKAIQFVSDGEDTEIDRGMVESLNDPLVHLIRNAVDHGIEPPQARQAAGKPAGGTVTLRAYHAAGSVVIELCDDGGGLNRKRILEKAVAKGIVPPGRELSDAEVHRLIFAAGFSTAETVTDVSGRGVGMDVVRRNIEALRGRIDIATTPGQGTTFSLRVPLTLAIIDGMLLRVGADRYVLPTVNIRQAFRPADGAIQTVTGRGRMVLFRGQMVPVFSLARLFSRGQDSQCETFADPAAVAGDSQSLLVVVEDDARQCALAVDELLGQQQVVIKSLGDGLSGTPGVSGGAILGDGRVGLILDVQGIVNLATGGSLSADEAA